MKWSVGVTTCKERLHDLLPHTLTSLKAAGFDRPRLFVDADWNVGNLPAEAQGCEPVMRGQRIGCWGNWLLGLTEMFIREPHADAYVLFQDDLVAVRNLRQYLEKCQWPHRSYLNLYTFLAENEQIIMRQQPGTWHEASLLGGHYLANRSRPQSGRGAVALVFPHDAVLDLLSFRGTVEKAGTARGQRFIDGAVVEALNRSGWREVVHCPSLVRHTGLRSVKAGVLNLPYKECPYDPDKTFPGEEKDALDWLEP